MRKKPGLQWRFTDSPGENSLHESMKRTVTGIQWHSSYSLIKSVMSSADSLFDIIFTSERLMDAFYEVDVFLEK